MRIVFQQPALGGDDAHDYLWALIDATGEPCGHFHTPEAALIEASIRLDVDLDTLTLDRENADTFTVGRRTQQRAGRLPPGSAPGPSPRVPASAYRYRRREPV